VVLLSCLAVVASGDTARALPGPPLREPLDARGRSLTCDPGVRGSAKTLVLLVHGTFATSAWWTPTYVRALPAAGHPTCTVEVPDREAGDVQRSVEYVVHAIRDVSRRARRPIAVIGHSQGAFLTTFALRYWPDLGVRVNDFVGLAGLYENGSALGTPLCTGGCPPSAWQLRPGSALLRAYARRPLYRGPSYTTIATAFDELVVPQPQAGRLSSARNIVLQDVCPGRAVEHGLITADAAAHALVMDALSHAGPAEPARVDRAVCAAALMPGSDPVGLAVQFAQTALGVGAFLSQPAGREPRVHCPFDPSCTRPRLRPRLLARSLVFAATRVVRVQGSVVLPPGALDQCAGRVDVRALGRARIVATRRARLGVDCRFGAWLRVGCARLPAALRIVARFAGNAELLGARTVATVARSPERRSIRRAIRPSSCSRAPR
jgi:pimeloyl-ACP methyl ester carboxylesterase